VWVLETKLLGEAFGWMILRFITCWRSDEDNVYLFRRFSVYICRKSYV